MMKLLILLIVCGGVLAAPKCKGTPRMYNGKRCATTTRYADGRKGACGCGQKGTDNPFNWNKNNFVAAANQLYFDRGGKKWCGRNCGKCVKLTTTGGFINGHGKAPVPNKSKTFMVTNLCPAESPNLRWCGQTKAKPTNYYGYALHFDLQDANLQITRTLEWDNPEVTVDFVTCPDHFKLKYSKCECSSL